MSVMGIQKPDIIDAGCWCVVRRYVGSLYAQGTNCGCKPLPGKLTCRYHTAYEARAKTCARRATRDNAAEHLSTPPTGAP